MDLLDWLLRVMRPPRSAPNASRRFTPSTARRCPRGHHRGAAGLRRLSSGARRQRSRPPSPARRLRPGARTHPSTRRDRCSAVGAPLAPRRGSRRAVEQRWTEPDQGIWEVRSAPRHHVNSKVMCWVTVDRAVQIAERCSAVNARVGQPPQRDQGRHHRQRLERRGRLVHHGVRRHRYRCLGPRHRLVRHARTR